MNTMLTWLLGSIPFDLLLDDSAPAAGSDVLPDFLSVDRRQAAQIPLDERLHRRQIEAADKNEREVAGVGKAVLVERHRLVEVHRSTGRESRLRADVALSQRRLQRLLEHRVGLRLSVGQTSSAALSAPRRRPDRRAAA